MFPLDTIVLTATMVVVVPAEEGGPVRANGSCGVHPVPVEGPWLEGFVLDRHVISAVPIGYLGEHIQFDRTRSALGELVYHLKY